MPHSDDHRSLLIADSPFLQMFQNLSQILFIGNNFNNFFIYKKNEVLALKIQNKIGDQVCGRYREDKQDQMKGNAVHWTQLTAEIWAWIVFSK